MLARCGWRGLSLPGCRGWGRVVEGLRPGCLLVVVAGAVFARVPWLRSQAWDQVFRVASVYVTLQAVFFDLDGTLIHSEPDWLAAEEEVMAWLGGHWGPEYQGAVV